MTPAEFQTLKDRVQRLETEAAQAQGAIEQLLSTLKEAHGCASVEEAARLAKRLEKEIAKDERLLDREFKNFEAQYGHLLEE